MVLFRILGYLLALAGFGFLIVDGARSIAAGELDFTPLGQTWADIDRDSLLLAQPAIERHIAPFLWDVVFTILQWPTFAVALVLGLIFVLIGRPRRSRAQVWY